MLARAVRTASATAVRATRAAAMSTVPEGESWPL